MANRPVNVRLRWAKNIMQAKQFVILTDKESIIALEGISPESLNDVIMLEEQAASLEHFMYLLKDLQQKHMEAIAKLGGERAKKVPTKRGKKIKVTEV